MRLSFFQAALGRKEGLEVLRQHRRTVGVVAAEAVVLRKNGKGGNGKGGNAISMYVVNNESGPNVFPPFQLPPLPILATSSQTMRTRTA